MKHFDSVLKVAVVDRNGKPTGEVRVLNNAPITALLPGEPIVYINWMHDGASRPDEEEVVRPVIVKDEIKDDDGIVIGLPGTYFGGRGWGSSVKKGYTIGMTRDILAGFAKFSEDGQRFQRAFLANGINGAAAGQFKVRFVKAGTVIPGVGPVEDGFGYISKATAGMVNNNADKINLGAARDSFHFWQRVPWTPEVEAECLPFINEELTRLAEGGFNFHINSAMEERKKFIDAEPKMAQHPWIANALARSSAEDSARVAMTVKTNSIVRVAVPSTVETVAATGKNTITRYPMDAWDSCGATDVANTPEVQAEMERIAKMDVIQYSLTSIKPEHTMFCKGCVGVVDDLGSYDMILCVEDRKMSSHKRSIAVVDGIFAATMWFNAGSAIGIGAKYWKEKGGDFDGDPAIISDCSERPELWKAISQYPKQTTFKLEKTHTELAKKDTRPGMIVKSMYNLVGMATNLMAATFAFSDRAMVAKRMGYTGLESMDNRLNFWIKAGTDIFKTDLDAAKIEKQMMQFQTQYCKQFGRLPAWVNWPNEWAFRHGVPEFWDGDGKYDKDNPVHKNSVPRILDGTIARILEHTLPSVKVVVETPIETRPLKEFIEWAGEAGPVALQHAKEIQNRFNIRTQSVNWEWDESVADFKNWLKAECENWMRHDHLSREDAANALWRAAHDVRSTYSGAASVFMAFQDEAYDIVKGKPGLQGDRVPVGVVLTGETLKQDELGEVDGMVVECKENKNGRIIIRHALKVLKFEFAFAPDQPVPSAGKYRVTLRRRSPKSFYCYCLPKGIQKQYVTA